MAAIRRQAEATELDPLTGKGSRGRRSVPASTPERAALSLQHAAGNEAVGRYLATVQRQEEAGGVVTLPETEIVAQPPRSLRSAIGTLDYYRQRNDDFVARADPGERPPDYYLDYGDLYVRRFTLEVRPALSPAGQAWVDATLRLLQQYMEDRRDANPWAFAELERDANALRSFAYETHSSAYVNGGVCDLSPGDWQLIVRTPEWRHLATVGGFFQIGESGMMCMGVWLAPEGMAPWGPSTAPAGADEPAP